ncbi:MAG: hypothetical protein PHN88_14995 [Ignavibacteria bacterium]|nr:hypothetical protein [Ignavibacteria bacterium]
MKNALISKVLTYSFIGAIGLILFLDLKSRFNETEENVLAFKNRVDSLEKHINDLISVAGPSNPNDSIKEEQIDASFKDSILSNDGKTAVVRFTAVTQDAYTYAWSFGDKGSPGDNKPIQIHSFNLLKQRDYLVVLKITKNDVTDADTLNIGFGKKDEQPDASFGYNAVHEKKNWKYKFRAMTRDADNYKWYINDSLTVDNKLPDVSFVFKDNVKKEIKIKLILTKDSRKAEHILNIKILPVEPVNRNDTVNVSITFRLKNNEQYFCYGDKQSYEFVLNPPGGKITRSDGGNVESANNKYYFTPGTINSKTKRLTFYYTINRQKSAYTVVFLDPSFQYQREPDSTKNQTKFKFIAVTGGYDDYTWKFSDTKEEFPRTQSITRTINNKKLANGVTVTLSVTGQKKTCPSNPSELKIK